MQRKFEIGLYLQNAKCLMYMCVLCKTGLHTNAISKTKESDILIQQCLKCNFYHIMSDDAVVEMFKIKRQNSLVTHENTHIHCQ